MNSTVHDIDQLVSERTRILKTSTEILRDIRLLEIEAAILTIADDPLLTDEVRKYATRKLQDSN